MKRKPFFTPDEIEVIFNGTNSEKYKILKKDLAKIIQRYLIANPEIRKLNEELYEKTVIIQSKSILCSPSATSAEHATQLVEMTAISDVEFEKENYSSQGAMRLIMNVFSLLK